MKLYSYGGYGVDIQLHSRYIPSDVFWGEKGNSYVVVTPRAPEQATLIHPEHGSVNLVSINGLGEIRWNVQRFDARQSEGHAAMKFFNLTLKKQ